MVSAWIVYGVCRLEFIKVSFSTPYLNVIQQILDVMLLPVLFERPYQMARPPRQ